MIFDASIPVLIDLDSELLVEKIQNHELLSGLLSKANKGDIFYERDFIDTLCK
jgi:hypothetical protein